MTKLIDGDRLAEFLESQSGIDALLIQLVLKDFEYVPPQTPMSQIDRPAREIVRRRDPGTSWEAAWSIATEKRQLLFRQIYALLNVVGPCTDDEIREGFLKRGLAHSASGLRTRRDELVKAGWVRDSGNKRPSDAGHPATVWEALPELKETA